MTDETALTVSVVIARAAEWIRSDLAGKDLAARARAEEALSAMIAAALADQQAHKCPRGRRTAEAQAA